MRTKTEIRAWRKKRIRKKVRGTKSKPRLSVFRSTTHIYAQIINDEDEETIVSASSLSDELKGDASKIKKSEMAKKVGSIIAKKCLEKDIKKVVFDRNGFVYHGRIKALADGAREAGLDF